MGDATVLAAHHLNGREVIVAGGGITGLAAAFILSRHGARVTLLERDTAPPVGSASDAFTAWQRPGAPQVRHSHVFLGRLRNLLRDHYPDLLTALLAAGARELRATERPPLPLAGLQPEPGDDDLVILACRRTTFEWVLRQRVLAGGGVTLVSGATVTGLLATRSAPPVIAGVRYRLDGVEHLRRAHLVVDASGRRSAAPEWLAAIGARPPQEKQEPSGIVYYTRFYRMRRTAMEPAPGAHPSANDFTWVKYAVFPADDGTFSITLAVPLAVPRLKVLAQAAAFDAMVHAIPGLAPWVAPEVSEPIGDLQRPVQAMGGLINRRRRFVDRHGPLALRLFVLGDAAYCTNPLYGRGCAQGFLHAHLLAKALREHPDDPAAAAVALDRRARAEIEPFYRASILADREAVSRAENRPPVEWQARAWQQFLEKGIMVAMRCDPVVFRAMLRMMNMLETPEQAFTNPRVVARTLLVMARGERYSRRVAPPPPPDREATIRRCERAVAAARV